MARRPTWRALALHAALMLVIASQGGLAEGAPDGLTEEEAAAANSAHDAEIQEAKDEFKGIDTNNDGFITREEILEMSEVPEREEIDEFFNTYDQNADGRVTFAEILRGDEELRKASEDKEL